MRYLGNKDKLQSDINDFLNFLNINVEDKKVIDCFAGTGSMTKFFALKNAKVTSNDYLYFSTLLSEMYFCSITENVISKLKVYNDSDSTVEGYIYKNYSPNGNRKYFSEINAKRIDFIINDIYTSHHNGEINDSETILLKGMLLEAISKISNIAGVYGAFLKKEDPRFFKDLYLDYESFMLKKIDVKYKPIISNSKIEKFVQIINDDIYELAYLDPPYTTQQYSHQYHLLETIAKNSKSEVAGITGSRAREIGGSDFSRKYKAEEAMFNLLKNLNAKNIVISYSNKGLITKSIFEKILLRLSQDNKVNFKQVKYKKYLNSVSDKNGDENFEYLFHINKKSIKDITYESPLNYSGSKYKMINFLKLNFPKNKNLTFIDIFGGGFNVGINSGFEKVVYNDYNYKVMELIKTFYEKESSAIIKSIDRYISKFKLSKNGRESYNGLRIYYNEKNNNPILLLLLIIFGFSHQIRFNNNLSFNNPVGLSDFNANLREKIISFSDKIKTMNVSFESKSYEYYLDLVDENTFIYLDPPYLITTASYNDGKRGFKGWNSKEELLLLDFIDRIDKKGAKFMLSNVIEHKGKENEILKDWILRNEYFVLECPNGTSKNRKEIIVKNYK